MDNRAPWNAEYMITNSTQFADKTQEYVILPLWVMGTGYLLGLDAVQCCREANTSCTPGSDRIGRLESTCGRTSSFIRGLGFYCWILWPAPVPSVEAVLCCPHTLLSESKGSDELQETTINNLLTQLSETCTYSHKNGKGQKSMYYWKRFHHWLKS